MAIKYAPRVKETTTTTGTGTYSLVGAATGFQGFVAGIGSTYQTWYCCANDVDWEIGIGTITDGTPDTLSRGTVVYSSNSNNAVDWPAGTRDIFCIFPPALLSQIYSDFASGTTLNSISIYSSLVLGVENSGETQYSTIVGDSNVIGVAAGSTSGVKCLGNNNYVTNNCGDAVVLGAGTHICNQSKVKVFSQSYYNAVGDVQIAEAMQYTTTTTGTTGSIPTTLQPVGSTSITGTVLYEISVIARQTGGSAGTVGDAKAWKLDAVATWAAGTPTQLGTTTSSVIGAATGASAWTCSLSFAETNPIRVTGATDKDILWVAYIRQVENSTGYEAP